MNSPLVLALLKALFMLLLCDSVAQAAAASSAASASCDWNSPGHNRYTGTVEAAVQRHQRAGLLTADEARQILAERAAGRRLVLTISRDAIEGPGGPYAPQLAGMHFGRASMCTGPADRSRWPADRRMASVTHCAATGACVTCPAACTNCSVVRRTAAPGEGPSQLARGLPVDQVGAMRGPLQLADDAAPVPALLPMLQPQAVTIHPSDVLAPPAARTFSDGAGISVAAAPPLALPATPAAPLLLALPAPVPGVPEPGTWWLWGVGVALVFGRARSAATTVIKPTARHAA